MGTIGSTSSSSSTSGTTSSSGIFTGSSSYSKDFQNVIDRAVAIASLPINLLTANQTKLTSKSDELSKLDTKFTTLQTALQSIQDALGGAGMQTTVSDPTVVSVSAGDGAVEGAYSVNVTNIGAYASSLSAQSWNSATDPSGLPGTYNLVIGVNTFSITPANNSAASVASAINAQYSGQVQATAINVGTASSPDYRISLKSATLGPEDLKLQVPAQTNLQWPQTATSGYAVSQTAATWDASGTPSTFTLSVDGSSYNISPTDNSAASVAAAINGLQGSAVTASVVDVGTVDSPDYRLQLQSSSAGVSTVDLQDAFGNSLQQQQTPPEAGLAISQTAWSWDATADPSGDPVSYTLTLGGATQAFTVTDNSATGVADAINGLGGPMHATVIDLGTASNPDYRIQLQSTTAGTDNPQLSRSTAVDLQKQGQPPGELAQYEVSSSGVTVSSNKRSVQIAAGTTVTLTGTGLTDITVTRSTATLNTALSSFSDAYNAAFKELNGQRGQAGGVLQGGAIVYQLSAVLSNISTYSASSGQVSGLASLGLSLGTDGKLTYSPYTLMATDIGNSPGVTAFLGSMTGGGFLQAAKNALNGIQDASTGLLKIAENDTTSQLTSLATTISDKQSQISQLQLRLQTQMARADAMIATMEQQYSYMSSMFTAMQTANQMYSK